MKKYLLLLLLLLSSVIKGQNREFIDIITSDLNRNGYYISVQIQTNNYDGKAVISNRDLRNLFTSYLDVKEEEYYQNISEIIKKKCKLYLGKLNLDEWGFIIVQYDQYIDLMSQKGEDVFISNFFNDKGAIKDNVPLENWAQIINILLNGKSPFLMILKLDC